MFHDDESRKVLEQIVGWILGSWLERMLEFNGEKHRQAKRLLPWIFGIHPDIKIKSKLPKGATARATIDAIAIFTFYLKFRRGFVLDSELIEWVNPAVLNFARSHQNLSGHLSFRLAQARNFYKDLPDLREVVTAAYALTEKVLTS